MFYSEKGKEVRGKLVNVQAVSKHPTVIFVRRKRNLQPDLTRQLSVNVPIFICKRCRGGVPTEVEAAFTERK